MKNNILLIAILLLATNASLAQSVESIDKRYANIAEMARLCEKDHEIGEFGELVMNSLEINSQSHQWRAVGTYGQSFKFFYKGGNSETRPYPDQLVFVTNDRRVSDQRYREEWLFSESGALELFVYNIESDPNPKQSRIYFSRGKPIKMVDGDKVTTRLSALDVKFANERAAQGRRIKELFTKSINL